MKKAILPILTAAILLTSAPASAAGRFSDVPDSNWAAPAITYMADQGVLNGYSDGTFKPNKPVTKAEFAHMYRALYPEAASKSADPLPYVDIKGHWAADDFSALFSKDTWIFTDHFSADGKKSYLSPDKQLTRWDMALMLGFLDENFDITADAAGNQVVSQEDVFKTLAAYKDIKMRNLTGTDTLNTYSPVILLRDGDSFASDLDNMKAVILYSAIKRGVMAGDGTFFRPADKVTRAETAAILHRLYTQ